MCKISKKVIKFIAEVMMNRKMELIAGGKTLTEVTIPGGIFQGDVLSSLLFIIAMMPLNHILRKYASGYNFTKSEEKINHQIYMDDINHFAKKGK